MTENIILDLRPEFEAFKFRTNGRVVNFKEFAKEVINHILYYANNASNGEDKLQEFLDTIEEVAVGEGMSGQDVLTIKDACVTLSEALFRHLQDIGAYDEQGSLGFKFRELLGNDIVLQPLEPEDFGLAVEDDDGLIPDDPLVAKEMVATAEQNDLANLYADVAVAEEDDDVNYITEE